MISTTAEHIALLATREFWAVDLYAIQFVDGSVLRYSSHPLSTTWNGVTYAGGGPLFSRGETRQVCGLEADSLSVEITPRETDTLLGLPFAAAVRNGALDGATFTLYRAHAATPGAPIVGAIERFSGSIEEVATELTITLTVKCDLMKLDAKIPIDVYQPGCSRRMYGAGCGVARGSYQYTSTAAGGSTQSIVKHTGLPQPAGYYTGGEIRFTSGLNAGARRSIKVNGDVYSLQLSYPLLHAVSAGDQFQLWPGCDHTWATCIAKFNNGAAFNGQPFIPDPETAL